MESSSPPGGGGAADGSGGNKRKRSDEKAQVGQKKVPRRTKHVKYSLAWLKHRAALYPCLYKVEGGGTATSAVWFVDTSAAAVAHLKERKEFTCLFCDSKKLFGAKNSGSIKSHQQKHHIYKPEDMPSPSPPEAEEDSTPAWRTMWEDWGTTGTTRDMRVERDLRVTDGPTRTAHSLLMGGLVGLNLTYRAIDTLFTSPVNTALVTFATTARKRTQVRVFDIPNAVKKIRESVMGELKDSPVSIIHDGWSKHNLYVTNIVAVSPACEEPLLLDCVVRKEHPKAHDTALWIILSLIRYEIPPTNVVAILSDNARSAVKAAKLIKAVGKAPSVPLLDTLHWAPRLNKPEITDDLAVEFGFEAEGDKTASQVCMEQVQKVDMTPFQEIMVLTCLSHGLQLLAHEVTQAFSGNYRVDFAKIVALVSGGLNSGLDHALLVEGVKRPLDFATVDTRWGSTASASLALLENQEEVLTALDSIKGSSGALDTAGSTLRQNFWNIHGALETSAPLLRALVIAIKASQGARSADAAVPAPASASAASGAGRAPAEGGEDWTHHYVKSVLDMIRLYSQMTENAHYQEIYKRRVAKFGGETVVPERLKTLASEIARIVSVPWHEAIQGTLSSIRRNMEVTFRIFCALRVADHRVRPVLLSMSGVTPSLSTHFLAAAGDPKVTLKPPDDAMLYIQAESTEMTVGVDWLAHMDGKPWESEDMKKLSPYEYWCQFQGLASEGKGASVLSRIMCKLCGVPGTGAPVESTFSRLTRWSKDARRLKCSPETLALSMMCICHVKRSKKLLSVYLEMME